MILNAAVKWAVGGVRGGHIDLEAWPQVQVRLFTCEEQGLLEKGDLPLCLWSNTTFGFITCLRVVAGRHGDGVDGV